MENIILYFFKNIYIVFIGIFILSFLVPIIMCIFKSKKKDKVLNKYSIFSDSIVATRVLAIFIMMLFIIIGLIIMYISSQEYDIDKNISGMIYGLVFILPSMIFIINTLKDTIKILKGKYVIIIDELMDKTYYNDSGYHGEENIEHSHWELYFKDYFKKYNEKIAIKSMSRGNSVKEGDKFYLVFVKGKKYPYIYECKKYKLDECENAKIKTIDEIKDYINKKEFVLEKIEQGEKTIINKKTIKNDFIKAGHRKTAIVFVLLCIFFVLFLAMSILVFENLIASIIVFLLMIFWFFLTIIKIKYILTICSNIDKGNFKIKEDEVVSLNNRIQYSDSNYVISFKFKNYKKLVYEDKRVYHDAQVGDKFYLVFVKGEKEPIKVYNANKSVVKEGK